VRRAQLLGNQCPQTNPDLPAWLDQSPQSEDCLVLNIWAPAAEPDSGQAQPVPVIVWIHGGAFTYGSAGAPVYDGAHLAERGEVVVVSVNHRLNAFGYAWFGDLVPELSEHANPGQRDLEMALLWVRANIAVFGGDPDNITLVGESGGGAKIGALCAAPTAAGLFDKMVIQSGAQTRVHDRASATRVAELLLTQLGIETPTLTSLAEISTDRLKEAVAAVEGRVGLLAFQPVVDGKCIVGQPWSNETLENHARIPLLIGTTSEETIAFAPELGAEDLSVSQAIEHLQAFFLAPVLSESQWQELFAQYARLEPTLPPSRLAVAVSTDLSFWGSTRHVLETRSAAATYCYEFAWQTPCFGSAWSPHAGELPFVFGNMDYPTAWDGTDNGEIRTEADPHGGRFRLSAAIIAAWTAFARHGNPSTLEHRWPRWTSTEDATMVLDGDGFHPVAGLKARRWSAIQSFPRGW